MLGHAPQEYLLIRAARYLGVAPWDLAGQPQWWMNVALAFEDEERSAQERAEKRKGRKGGSASTETT